jgi:hypothetical protein
MQNEACKDRITVAWRLVIPTMRGRPSNWVAIAECKGNPPVSEVSCEPQYHQPINQRTRALTEPGSHRTAATGTQARVLGAGLNLPELLQWPRTMSETV